MFGWQERPLEKAGQLEARFGAVLGDFEAVWTSVPFKALRWSPALMGGACRLDLATVEP